MTPLRVGLVGCGEVAQYGHLPAITADPRLTLAAICDTDPGRLASARAPDSTLRCLELDRFARAGLDALVITSPAPVHRTHVEWAARHQLPVLCEKPLALDDASSLAMVATMERARLPLFVGFTYRFSDVATTIKRLIREGAVGEPRALRLIYLWDLHGKYADRATSTGINARRETRMAEGGPLIDCGVHQIDLARWWLGGDPTIEAALGVWVEEHEAPDHVVLHLDVAGCHVMVELSFSYGHTAPASLPTFSYEVVGTEGVIRYRREERDFTVVGRHASRELPWAHEKSFSGMYAAFAGALTGTHSDIMATGHDGVIATRIARAATDQVIQSATRRPFRS